MPNGAAHGAAEGACAPATSASSRASRRIVAASMPVASAARSGVNAATSVAQPVDVVRVRRQELAVLEPFLEDRPHHREEQERVAAGADEVMLLRDLRGLGPPRIDHHDLAAALADRLQARLRVDQVHQRALGDERIRADDEQELRAIDVGHGLPEARAVEEARRQEVGQVVLRAGTVRVPRADRLDPVRRVDAVRVRVAGRVTGVERDRVGPVRGADGIELARRSRRSPAPTRCAPSRRRCASWVQDAVGVVRHLVRGEPLRAGVAA